MQLAGAPADHHHLHADNGLLDLNSLFATATCTICVVVDSLHHYLNQAGSRAGL